MSALKEVGTKPGDVFHTVGRNRLLNGHHGTWTIIGEGLDTRPDHLGKPVVIFMVEEGRKKKVTMLSAKGFNNHLNRGSIARKMVYVNPKQVNVLEGTQS